MQVTLWDVTLRIVLSGEGAVTRTLMVVANDAREAATAAIEYMENGGENRAFAVNVQCKPQLCLDGRKGA
jgi:hypothetical protein